MKMKKKLALILAALISLSAFAGCADDTASSTGDAAASGDAATVVDEATLNMTFSTSETSVLAEGANLFKERVEEETGGKIKINIYPNDQLAAGNQSKSIEMLATGGGVDISINSNILYTSMDPKLTVISMPWIVDSIDDLDQKLQGEGGQILNDILAEKGIEGFLFAGNGFRQLTNNVRPVETVEDLAGMKIRIPGIQMYTSLYTTLGTDPIAMNFGEVFSSLQTKTIDGQENPLDIIDSSKFAEVQEYLTIWDYSAEGLYFGFNGDKFNSFSPETQEILMSCAHEAADHIKTATQAKEAEQLAYFQENMQVNILTDEQKAAFREASQPVYDEFTPIIGEELLNLFAQ